VGVRSIIRGSRKELRPPTGKGSFLPFIPPLLVISDAVITTLSVSKFGLYETNPFVRVTFQTGPLEVVFFFSSIAIFTFGFSGLMYSVYTGSASPARRAITLIAFLGLVWFEGYVLLHNLFQLPLFRIPLNSFIVFGIALSLAGVLPSLLAVYYWTHIKAR
jgi:hypothetical protein